MLKAIDTWYNGYRFRSRTEARWAVFFDVLEIGYEYEAQGYSFEGYNYLPDFWIREWDAFVEIKGTRPSNEELQRHIAFARHADKNLLIFYGRVSVFEHRVLLCSPTRYEGDNLQLAWCRRGCGQLFVQNDEFGAQPIGLPTDHDCWHRADCGHEGCPPGYIHVDLWPSILGKAVEAFDIAQGARFEFGEAWHAGLTRNQADATDANAQKAEILKPQ